MNTETTSTTEATTEATNKTLRFFAYDAKQQYPAPDGKRLVQCMYREKKDSAGNVIPAARPNEAMFIPDWITEEYVANNLPLFMDYIVSYLQQQEDQRVKEAHRRGSMMLGEVFFSARNLMDYLDQTTTSSKLSAELIDKWFAESDLKVALTAHYIEIAGEEKAVQLIPFIAKKLSELAAVKPNWNEPEIIKFMEILEPVRGDSVGRKLYAKLESMKARIEIAENLIDCL